jgi:hypothetical protein
MIVITAMPRSSVAITRRASTGRKEARHHPKLVLASEALKEDIAPFEPGRGAGRLGIGGVAVALLLLGLAMRFGVGRGALAANASSVTFAAGGAGLAVAALPFSYPIRAGAAAALGIALIALGMDGIGPLSIVRSTPDALRFVALIALPGALLFRARYRAYRRARWVLVAALVAALPYAVDRARTVADASLPIALRAGAAADIFIILSGLFGFMGEYTTGGSSVWAALVIFVLSGNVALRQLEPARFPDAALLTHAGVALAVACAATLVTIGFFHLLSARLARDARRWAKLQQAAAETP